METLDPSKTRYERITYRSPEYHAAIKHDTFFFEYPTYGLAFFENNVLKATIFEDSGTSEGLKIVDIARIVELFGVKGTIWLRELTVNEIPKYIEKNIGSVVRNTSPLIIKTHHGAIHLPDDEPGVLVSKELRYQSFYYMHPKYYRQQGVVLFKGDEPVAMLPDEAYSRRGLDISDLKKVLDLFGVEKTPEPFIPSDEEFENLLALSTVPERYDGNKS